MTTDQPNRCDSNDEETPERGPEGVLGLGCTSFDVERSGDWMPSEDLREAALAALGTDGEIVVNLDRIDHLDASALQILLALDLEQKRRGLNLKLDHASPYLSKWFAFAGAADQFSMTGRVPNA